jgi:hypothetical protein
MSNISNQHSVVPFKAGDKALSGQRLAKVGYKSSKKNPARFKGVAVSVPFLPVSEIQENLQALLPHIGTMLENAQDGLIRTLYESADGALSQVSDDEISIPAIIGWLNAEAAGDRMTKDRIESWFDSELSENLTAHIADKLGYMSGDGALTEAQESTIGKHVRVYRDVLSMLAGGKTLLADKQIKGCRNALALCPDDSDSMAQKLIARLDAMEKKEKIEDLLEL